MSDKLKILPQELRENADPEEAIRPMPWLAAVVAIGAYLSRDYSANPFYPTHRTEDEKRELRNKRARAARAKKKGTECK